MLPLCYAFFHRNSPCFPADFTSQYLYLMWYRSNMVLSGFYPPSQEIPREPLATLSYDRFVR